MISVAVSGALGRMGSQICKAVSEAADMELVAAFDPRLDDPSSCKQLEAYLEASSCFSSLEALLERVKPEVLIDFTCPDALEANLSLALGAGVGCVVGTTGLSEERLHEIHNAYAKDGAKLFFAPNFTTGAVLMMVFSKLAAGFFEDAEVLEFHHNGKKDAPSGTAMRTARLIAQSRKEQVNWEGGHAPGKESELEEATGARGASLDGVQVHAIRSNGYVAHQEVIFGSAGQTLTIRHDSIDRSSYMPGILLAVRKLSECGEVTIGLEKLMGL